MEIKELRAKSKMSQSQFAKYLQIPVSSLQNWEAGRRRPPEYLIPLIEKSLLYDGILSRKDLLSNEEDYCIRHDTFVTANEFAIDLVLALADEYSFDKAIDILDKIHYWDTINDDDACCLWAHYGLADIAAQAKEDLGAVLSRNNKGIQKVQS